MVSVPSTRALRTAARRRRRARRHHALPTVTRRQKRLKVSNMTVLRERYEPRRCPSCERTANFDTREPKTYGCTTYFLCSCATECATLFCRLRMRRSRLAAHPPQPVTRGPTQYRRQRRLLLGWRLVSNGQPPKGIRPMITASRSPSAKHGDHVYLANREQQKYISGSKEMTDRRQPAVEHLREGADFQPHGFSVPSYS